MFTENAVRSQLLSADCVGERKLLDEDRIDVLPIGSDKLFHQQTIGHLDSQHDQYDRRQSAEIDATRVGTSRRFSVRPSPAGDERGTERPNTANALIGQTALR